MFRDGHEIAFVSKGYGGLHDKAFFREDKKKFYTKDCFDVKKEINRLKRNISLIESKIKRNGSSESLEKTLNETRKDLSFWINEMNKFDNLPSHKTLKSKKKKYKSEILREKVIEIINESISKEIYFLRKEDITFRLQINKKDLDKLFMELNREGILSQAEHKLMHDSIRGGAPLEPDEMGDWAADIYYIRKKEN